MKRILSVAIVLLLVAILFCGCGKDMGRINYNYDMKKYVELDSYAVEIDRTSEEYKEYYSAKIKELLVEKRTKGTIASGDVANIDYVGKKDGVAFEGGTDSGYDLVIGSNSFISGFEEGLIGVEIGSTIDLNLTFPSSYHATELAGKAVVFTVTVNYVTVNHTELNEENAKACGYSSAKVVEDAANEYATENIAWDTVCAKAKIEDMPQKEHKIFLDEQINYFTRLAQANGMTFESLAQYYGMTKKEFEEYLDKNFAVQSSYTYMVSYYILDAAGVKVTKEKVKEVYDRLCEEEGTQIATLGISEAFVEAYTVNEMALDIVLQNVTLK